MSTSFIIASINKAGNVLSTYCDISENVERKGKDSFNNFITEEDSEEIIEFRNRISLNPTIPLVKDLGNIEKYPTVEEWMSSIKEDIKMHIFMMNRWFDSDRETIQSILDDDNMDLLNYPPKEFKPHS